MPRVFVQIEPFSFHLGGLQSFLVCLERSQGEKQANLSNSLSQAERCLGVLVILAGGYFS